MPSRTLPLLVALNPVIKFTTLFGLLAVELAIELNPVTAHIWALVFFLIFQRTLTRGITAGGIK